MAIRLVQSALAAEAVEVQGPGLAVGEWFYQAGFWQAAQMAFPADLFRELESPLAMPWMQIGRDRFPGIGLAQQLAVLLELGRFAQPLQ